MIDYSQLKTEIQTDPKGLGYSPFVQSGDDVSIASLFNQLSAPGSGLISLSLVTRNNFLTAIRPAYLSLPALSSATQMKWDRILTALNTSDNITIDDTTKYLLSTAVADSVLTQAQADGAWHRAGSRAEVLFGADTYISHSDVSFALRGAR